MTPRRAQEEVAALVFALSDVDLPIQVDRHALTAEQGAPPNGVFAFVAARVGIPNMGDIRLCLAQVTPGDLPEHHHRHRRMIRMPQAYDVTSVFRRQVLKQQHQRTTVRADEMQTAFRGEIRIGPRLIGKSLHELCRHPFRHAPLPTNFSRKRGRVFPLSSRSDELCNRYSGQRLHGGILPCRRTYRCALDRARCRTPSPNSV